MQPVPTLPRRLQGARARSLGLLLGCVAFVAGGIFIRQDAPWAGYSAIVFFGLGAIVATINLLPGSSYLLLDDRGLTMCSMFRKTFHSWNDLAEFLPISMGTTTMVGLRYSEGYKAHAATRRLATRLAGAEGALPESYGMDPEELVTLLNGLRMRQRREF